MPTTDSLRVFLAISLPQTASSSLQRQLSPLKLTLENPNLRWIPPQNWHVTVKFVGTLQTQKIPVLTRELTAELQQSPSFQLTFTSVDWFPNDSKPTMLTATPSHSEALNQLAVHMDETLARYDIEHNNRAFRAHLSLARNHKGAKLASPQSLPHPLTPIAVSVNHIGLYQSQFKKQGVCYSKLASFKLLS